MPSETVHTGINEYKKLSKKLKHTIDNLLKEKKLSSLDELKGNTDRYRQITFLFNTLKEIEKAINASKINEEGVLLFHPPTIYPASILRIAIDLVCQEIYASYTVRSAEYSKLYVGLVEILEPSEEKTQIDLLNIRKQTHLTLENLKARLNPKLSYLETIYNLFSPLVSTHKETEILEEAAAPAGPAGH